MRVITKFLPSYKNIWTLSFPLIIASISETIINVTDTIFLSHYGMRELAALGLADSLYAVSLFLILGFVDGIQITIGRRAGQEKHLQIGKVFNQGLYLLALLSGLMILFVLFAIPHATLELFESREIHLTVNLYLQIAIFGLFFHSLNLALSAFYVGISRTKIFITATILLAVINITLDYLLIFGNFGFAEMGIEGAALASLCAEISVSLFLIIDIYRRGYNEIYGIFQFERFNYPLMKTLSILSAPVSMEVLIESLRWFAFFLIIEQLGEEPLAIATIIFSCYALLMIPIDAFAETICSMASNLLGQNDEHKMLELVSKTIRLGYLTIVPVLIATLVFPEYILAIFSSDEAIISGSIASLMVIIFATLLAVPANVMTSTVAGTGDTFVTFAIELLVSLATLGYAYYAAFVASFSLEFIWFSEVIGWGISLLLSWLWLKSGFWKRLNI